MKRRALAGSDGLATTRRTEQDILDHATQRFLWDGYAATSVEAIAKSVGISKQAIYTRWEGKPFLFEAVLRRLAVAWRSRADPGPLVGLMAEAALGRIAAATLDVALSPEALALHRLLLQERRDEPDLARAIRAVALDHSAEVMRIALLLRSLIDAGRLPVLPDPALAAEQFLALVIGGPRSRALGLDEPMNESARGVWVARAVRLLLCGWRDQAAEQS
jgi:TetR/AcrR family transcriptional regulator, mexJK operon transcriptional repressor